MESSNIVEINFAQLPDGTLVEMIEDPANPGKAILAVYRDRTVTFAERLEERGRTLVPLPRADRVLQHVCLAQGVEAHGALLDLVGAVASFFNMCLDLEMPWRILLTAYVMSTWFPEQLQAAPYVALVGPPGSGKTTALRVLNLLCYRSLLTADITSAAFYEISDRIRPTILLDETLTSGHSRELMHLLRATSTTGFVSLRKDKARLAFGPKAFSWLELPDDAALNSRCLIVPMHKTARTDLKSPNHPTILAFAKKVRMQLQQFRFEHFDGFPAPKIPADVKLSGRQLDLYRAVALPITQDEKLCEILARLIEQQSGLQTAVLSPAQATVLHVLYSFIHKKPEAPAVGLSALTAVVNSELAERGESIVNERKMGNILTSLSLTNRLRTNTGYILLLDPSTRERIHANARDHRTEDPVEDCKICSPTDVSVNRASSQVAKTEAATTETTPSAPCERGERRERPSRTRKMRPIDSTQSTSDLRGRSRLPKR
jgi:energy-coupling factor transporter ATP-binding protein EcfA2